MQIKWNPPEVDWVSLNTNETMLKTRVVGYVEFSEEIIAIGWLSLWRI